MDMRIKSADRIVRALSVINTQRITFNDLFGIKEYNTYNRFLTNPYSDKRTVINGNLLAQVRLLSCQVIRQSQSVLSNQKQQRMIKNHRAPSHLSTSFNTLSLYPEDSHKSLLSLHSENQRNTQLLLSFKSELLALHRCIEKSKSESDQLARRSKNQLENEKTRCLQLQETNASLTASIELLLLCKLDQEKRLQELLSELERKSEDIAKIQLQGEENEAEIVRLTQQIRQIRAELVSVINIKSQLDQKVSQSSKKLSSMEAQNIEMKSRYDRIALEMQLLCVQKKDLNEENHRVKRQFQKIKNDSLHQNYKVELLQQTLNGGLGQLKSLQDKARRQLEGEVQRLRELLSSCERLLETKQIDMVNTRLESKSRGLALMQQIVVLQQLNRGLQSQGNSIKTQTQMVRCEYQSRLQDKMNTIKELSKENESVKTELQSIAKLYRSSRQALQKQVLEHQGQVESYSKGLMHLEDVLKDKEGQFIKLNQVMNQKIQILSSQFESKLGQRVQENQVSHQELVKENQKNQQLRAEHKLSLQLASQKEAQILNLSTTVHNLTIDIQNLKQESLRCRDNKEISDQVLKNIQEHSKEQIRALREELRQSFGQQKLLQQELRARSQSVTSLGEHLRMSKEQLHNTQDRYRESKKELDETRTNTVKLIQTQNTLQQLRHRLVQLKQVHCKEEKRSKENNQSLHLQLSSLKESLRCLQNYNRDLEKSNTLIEKQLAESKLKKLKNNEESMFQLMEQLNQSQNQISRLSGENTVLAEKVDSLYKEMGALKTGDNLTFRQGGQLMADRAQRLQTKLADTSQDLKSEQLKANRYREESIVQAREIELLESKLLAKEQIIQSMESQTSSHKLQFELEKTQLYSMLNRKAKEVENLREEVGLRHSLIHHSSRDTFRHSQETLAFSLQSENTFQQLDKTKIRVEMRTNVDDSIHKRRKVLDQISFNS